MVCLNDYISFNKLKLRNNLKKEINDHILRLDFDLDIEKIKLEQINKKLNEKLNDLFSSDNFIYLNTNDNHCIHKFKKGKKEGYFCFKQITKNGDKDNYVCTKHNKNHIPKKRIKNIKEKTNEILQNQTFKNNENKNNNNFIIKIKNNKNKIFKKNKIKNNKKNKKIFVCNGGTINIGYILNMLL